MVSEVDPRLREWVERIAACVVAEQLVEERKSNIAGVGEALARVRQQLRVEIAEAVGEALAERDRVHHEELEKLRVEVRALISDALVGLLNEIRSGGPLMGELDKRFERLDGLLRRLDGDPIILAPVSGAVRPN